MSQLKFSRQDQKATQNLSVNRYPQYDEYRLQLASLF